MLTETLLSEIAAAQPDLGAQAKKSTIFNNFYKKLEGKMKGAAIEKIC